MRKGEQRSQRFLVHMNHSQNMATTAGMEFPDETGFWQKMPICWNVLWKRVVFDKLLMKQAGFPQNPAWFSASLPGGLLGRPVPRAFRIYAEELGSPGSAAGSLEAPRAPAWKRLSVLPGWLPPSHEVWLPNSDVACRGDGLTKLMGEARSYWLRAVVGCVQATGCPPVA